MYVNILESWGRRRLYGGYLPSRHVIYKQVILFNFFQKKKNFSFLVDNKFITHVKPEQSRKRKPIDGPWTLFNSSPS